MREAGIELDVIEAGRVDYLDAWRRQRELADARVAGNAPDTVLLLTHPSVYTAGRRTRPEDLPTDGTPVVDVDRGGRITWHGPGQLVGYPVVRLAAPVDLVGYVRLLEQVLMAVCGRFGLTTGRVPGRSGVWLAADGTGPERKIAAIGVHVAKRVATHGFALNCDPDLSAFDRIVPCGIRDAGVTSMSVELGRAVTVGEVLPVLREYLIAGLTGQLAVTDDVLARPAADAHPGLHLDLDPALAG